MSFTDHSYSCLPPGSSAGFCSAAVGFFLGVGALLLGSDSKFKHRSREINRNVGQHDLYDTLRRLWDLKLTLEIYTSQTTLRPLTSIV